MAPMDPRSERIVRRTAMVGAVTATYLLLTADYGPNYPNPEEDPKENTVTHHYLPAALKVTRWAARRQEIREAHLKAHNKEQRPKPTKEDVDDK